MFKSRIPLGDDFSNATNFFVSKPNDVSNLEQRETHHAPDRNVKSHQSLYSKLEDVGFYFSKINK